MSVESLPRESGDHTATPFTFKIVQVCRCGEWKVVQEGKQGKAESRGGLGDGKAGAENTGLGLLIFPLEPGRHLG